MPLHTDDPNAPGNLTDEEYEAETRRRMDELGDDGLHTIPEDVLTAAVERAESQGRPE